MKRLVSKLIVGVFLCGHFTFAQIAFADITNVHIDTSDGITTVEVVLNGSYIVREPSDVKAPTKNFTLQIQPVGDSQSVGWYSSQISFDEPDHDLTQVTFEGDPKKGHEIIVALRDERHVEILPQSTRSHILFTISNPQAREELAQRIKNADSYRFAVSLEESSKESVLLSLPSSIATKYIVYSLPNEASADGTLNVGFWDSERAARRARAQIVEHFPNAKVTTVDRAEEVYAYKYRLNPRIALERAELVESVPKPQTPRMEVTVVTPDTIGATNFEKKPLPIRPADDAEPDPLMEEADAAFRKHDYSRAIGLYTKIRQRAGPQTARVAHEKLGTSRELNGQHAHAIALYREYLATYQGTSDSKRVEQRLAALTSLTGDDPPTLRATKGASSDWRTFANVSQFYRRHELKVNEHKSVPIEGVFTNVALVARSSSENYDQEGQLSLTHLLDQTGNLEGRTFQVSSAYWDLYSSNMSTGVKFGRQTKYDAGVIGRFDGATVRHHFNDRIELGLVGGFLLDSSFDKPNSQRPFQGIYGSFRSAGGSFSISPFMIQQEYEGTVDRQAVGLQSQWIGESRFIMALIDYDFHHQALNNVTVMANLGIGKASSFSLSFDQRRSPYLTTRNALIGQPFEELSELEEELVDLSLKELAADRTAVSRNVRLAWNRKLSDRWEFSTDIVASDISDTDSSANVIGYDSRQDIYYSTQVRANDLFGPATYSGIMLRHAAGETSSTTSMYWNNRFQLGSRWWVYPRVRVDQRTFSSSDQSQLSIIPTIRVDYSQSRRFRFQFEVGYESTTRDTVRNDIDVTGIFVSAGYRAVF